MSEPALALDRKGLFAIIAVGLVIAPLLIAAAGWKLTRGFDLAGMSGFEWTATVLGSLLVGVIVRRVGAELGGSIGVVIDDTGVRRGGTRLSWAAITEVSSPQFGYLDLRSGGGAIRIATYLFAERVKLLEYISERIGVEVRERTLSL